MKLITGAATAFVLACALASPARAEPPSSSAPAASAPAAGAPTQAEMRERMEKARGIMEQVRTNPALANDPNFLKENPRFAKWLERHPDAKDKLTKNPEQFFKERDARREAMKKRRLEQSAPAAPNG
ncbi:MAG: hypothetical protein ACREQB_05140 [Candidatus Binataceae bacterium]